MADSWGIQLSWKSGEAQPQISANFNDGKFKAEVKQPVPLRGQAAQSPVVTAGYKTDKVTAEYKQALPSMMPGHGGVKRASFSLEAKDGNWSSKAELSKAPGEKFLGKVDLNEKTSGFKSQTDISGQALSGAASIQSKGENSFGVAGSVDSMLGQKSPEMNFQIFKGDSPVERNESNLQETNQEPEPELRRLPPVD